MKKSLLTLMAGAALAIMSFAATAHAQMKDPDVGGAAMFPTKNIVENAVNSPIHKTLVAAVKAAGLVDTLEGPGPYTVFAPTDDAFAKLPAGTVDNLVKPENHDTLVKILTYHVVPRQDQHQGPERLDQEGQRHVRSKDRARWKPHLHRPHGPHPDHGRKGWQG